MRIAVGSDHRALKLKAYIVSSLRRTGHHVVDCGIHTQTGDYPQVAFEAGQEVGKDKCDRAILLCSSGIGMCIAANKVPGVRAALCHTEEEMRLSREHNDANVLCLAGNTALKNRKPTELLKMIRVWLGTGHSEEQRHRKRVSMIRDFEYASIKEGYP